MNIFYCDNCGSVMRTQNERHIWFKSHWSDESKHYGLELCDICYFKFTKHLRRLCYRYKRGNK